MKFVENWSRGFRRVVQRCGWTEDGQMDNDGQHTASDHISSSSAFGSGEFKSGVMNEHEH